MHQPKKKLNKIQNGHTFFRLGSPSNGNLHVEKSIGSIKSHGRRMIKFGEGASRKEQPSEKIVREGGKVHSNESERMIAEALEKIQQRRKKSEKDRFYEKHSESSDATKDSDYDAEKLIEQANITEFLKL